MARLVYDLAVLTIGLTVVALLSVPLGMSVWRPREKRLHLAVRVMFGLVWSTVVLLVAEFLSGPQFGVVDLRRLEVLTIEVAALPICAAVLAMRPLLRGVFGVLVCASLAVICLWFSTFLALVILNRELDRGPSSAHREVAIRYTWRHGVNRYTGFKIQSWIGPVQEVVVDTCERGCPDLRDMVTVYARPGWLGFEWIARYEFDELATVRGLSKKTIKADLSAFAAAVEVLSLVQAGWLDPPNRSRYGRDCVRCSPAHCRSP